MSAQWARCFVDVKSRGSSGVSPGALGVTLEFLLGSHILGYERCIVISLEIRWQRPDEGSKEYAAF